jgi:hypothetical protein
MRYPVYVAIEQIAGQISEKAGDRLDSRWTAKV